MLFRNVEPRVIDECAESLGVTVYRQSSDPRRAVLRPVSDTFRRVRNGRRLNAVCWHGHRDFFRCLFEQAPGAIVETVIANTEQVKYTADNFEAVYFETGDINCGSIAQPLAYRDTCKCEEAGQ